MRLLRELVDEDQNAAELLAVALPRATRRVVVKRPRLGGTAGRDRHQTRASVQRVPASHLLVRDNAPATTPVRFRS
jgi:hypothetical protein